MIYIIDRGYQHQHCKLKNPISFFQEENKPIFFPEKHVCNCWENRGIIYILLKNEKKWGNSVV